jgi:hypothetical protein
MHRPLFRFVPLLAAFALASACSSTPTSTTPTTPTTVTDNFSGTVTPNGAVTHTLIVLAAGQITATLTSVSPNPDTQVLGLALGTWNGTACQIVIANDAAKQGTQVLGTASATGTFCARVYDVGSVVDPVSYALQVVHP